MKKNNSEMPLIGFISYFSSLGETYPLVAIAKKYIELGGKAIFFGYGKKYQYLARDIGCDVITLTYDISEKLSKKFHKKGLTVDYFFLHIIDKDNYQSDIINIKKEVEAFKDTDIKLIVTGNAFVNYLCKVSARKANIPLVYIVSGKVIPPYYQQNLADFPDNFENLFTRLIPGFIKNRFTNWFIVNSKSSVKEFNRLAHTYNTPKINHYLDIFSVEYTLVLEDINFLNIKPTAEFPRENFVGPILAEDVYTKKGEQLDYDIEQHLKRPGKSILLTMGSSAICKKLFLRILNILDQTDYNVIATYTNILNDNETPKLNENILLKNFITNITKLNQMVDLAIISGGRGTVYTAAFSGKPAIGIPLQHEQQCNLDNLVRHKTTIMVSNRNFTEKKLITAINNILTNYDTFLKNAQQLKEKLQEPKGAENTVKRLLEIIEKNKS